MSNALRTLYGTQAGNEGVDGSTGNGPQCGRAAEGTQQYADDDVIESCPGSNFTRTCQVIIYSICVLGQSRVLIENLPVQKYNFSWMCTIVTSLHSKKYIFCPIINYWANFVAQMLKKHHIKQVHKNF